MTATPEDVVADLGRENARLRDELNLARDRQNASAEILRAIASASADAEHSLKQIAETTARLFGAPSVTIRLAEGRDWGKSIHFGAISEPIRTATPAELRRLDGDDLPGTVYRENRQVHIPDLDNIDPTMAHWPVMAARANGTRTVAATPLRGEGKAIGVLLVYRDQLAPFTDEELALQQSFADQAVIAIENTRLFNETREALERQTATGEILKVIASSPSDVQPVFEAIATSANRLLRGFSTAVFRFIDGIAHLAAFTPTTPAADEVLKSGFPGPLGGFEPFKLVQGGQPVKIPDIEALPDSQIKQIARARGFRSMVFSPLMSDGSCIGLISVTRLEPGGFAAHHVQLLQTFADQAVIAIENVRLFDEVQARTRDLTESLQQQTATAEVLKVISRSAFDLKMVLDTLTESAARLCNADMAAIARQDTRGFYHATNYNFSVDWVRLLDPLRLQPERGSLIGRVLLTGAAVQISDVLADPEYAYPDMQKAAGYRTILGVPLLRGKEPIGVLFLGRKTVEPFTDKQIELVSTFADQAVIAIENVRLFDEVQAKTRELSDALTYQTGSGNILSVIASSPTNVGPTLRAIVESACQFCEAYDAVVILKDGRDLEVRAHHGPIPMNQTRWINDRTSISGRAIADVSSVHLRDVLSDEGSEFPAGQEMSRRDGCRTILAVPLLREGEGIGTIVLRRTEVHPFSDKQISLLQTFADQAVIAIGNVHLFQQVQARTQELAASLEELRTAQDRLVQTEKLASLGQLTAGIAHEIKNPLNFVNNFAALSAELTDELNDVLKPATLDGGIREEIDDLTRLLKGNLEKVVQHGKRADSIVKNMLLHSREGSGDHRSADINALLEESLNLAYHGARAEKPEFNVTLQRDLDEMVGSIELFPQEITRVFLNLISNGFYAVTKRKLENGGAEFEPLLSAVTRNLGDSVEIRIRDNGTGIPPGVRDKIFNPFFTTKPAGEGTGLGLSMSHDIIVKQHGGSIGVQTEPGQFTEFTIVLPRTSNLKDRKRGEK